MNKNNWELIHDRVCDCVSYKLDQNVIDNMTDLARRKLEQGPSFFWNPVWITMMAFANSRLARIEDQEDFKFSQR